MQQAYPKFALKQMKCDDCDFVSSSPSKRHEHANNSGHRSFSGSL